MDDKYIYYAALPDGIDEMVTPCPDGYTIYINKNLSSEQMLHAYRHALRHIKHNDFLNENVQKIEHRAHSKYKQQKS